MSYTVIDGSMGEGGGQILRTSIALASVLMKPIRITNIRAKRRNPGLQSQHLTAVKAAAELTGAAVEGLYLGSTEVTYVPKGLRPGRYYFDVGTAGSVTLVLQTITPIMAFMPGPCEVEIKGGTDVPWSPPIDYFRNVIAYHLRMLGIELQVRTIRRGHYPMGGGVIVAKVLNSPADIRPVELVMRGEPVVVKGVSHCVKLPRHVAERQAAAAERCLREYGIKVPVDIELEHYERERDHHIAPGSGIVLWAETDNGAVLGADALGARGKMAEDVGVEAARKLVRELSSGAALDSHMSDNIIPYLALAKGRSVVGGSSLTLHTYTVVEVVRKVANAEIEVHGEIEKPFRAVVYGRYRS